MSGLAAIFNRDGGPVLESDIRSMLRVVPHRATEGTAEHVHGSMGLGHARMVVTPEEHEELQPLASAASGCVIIADARLDNRDELLSDLPGGLSPRAGDAELILRAYEAWGLEAAAKLVGDFAFVIWDPHARRMVAARDGSGQRTLFYRLDRQVFAAASEIQQLLQDPTVPCEPDVDAIHLRLTPAHVYAVARDLPSTCYRGIHAVPAGHLLWVEGERHGVERFWDLVPGKELRYRTDAEYAEHYRELLFRAVADRMRTHHPIGALLSGGLDSTSVVGSLQELLRTGKVPHREFTAFSMTYGELDCDERHLISDLRDKYEFRSLFLPFWETGGSLNLQPRGFAEGPYLPGGDTVNPLWDAIQDHQVRTVMTGDIADACVYGSRLVLDSLVRQGQLRRFWRHLQAYRSGSDDSLRDILLFGLALPLLPLQLHRRLLAAHTERSVRACQDRLLPRWMPGSVRQRLGEQHLQHCVARERERHFSSPAREDEYRLIYPPAVGRDPVGRSIQVSRPFSDRRLLEFLFAIPPDQKFEPDAETNSFYAGGKWLVRRAMEGILPDSIRLQKRKNLFGAAVKSEISTNWSTYEVVFGPRGDSEVAARGFIDPLRFWARLQELRYGGDAPDLLYVMTVIDLETWLRRFRQPREDLICLAPAPDAALPRRDAREKNSPLLAGVGLDPGHGVNTFQAERR